LVHANNSNHPVWRIGAIIILCSLLGCAPRASDHKNFLYQKPQATNQAIDYQHVSGVIHLQTPVSGGKRTLDDYSALAREQGIGFLGLTDHDTLCYEYGLWPCRWLIKKQVDFPSVFKIGADKYLEQIKNAAHKTSEVTFIDGVESAPFYYWTGSYFKKNLVIHDRGRHMLVLGLKTALAYNKLPCIGNKQSAFDAYQGDQFYQPYQDLIDYVNQHNGLTFWAHPEAQEKNMVSGVLIETPAYPEALVATVNYTGFAILSEGFRRTGSPGGFWDRALKEYCEGKRVSPPWAIGELDDYGDKQLNSIVTVCLVKQNSYEAIIEALRYGRAYAITQPELRLDRFCIRDEADKKSGIGPEALSGEEIKCKGAPIIKISISLLTVSGAAEQKITVTLLRDGKRIKEFNKTLPCTIEFRDSYYKTNEKVFYRLEATTEIMGRLVSNPIFVSFE
jgi:hypothetical protein